MRVEGNGGERGNGRGRVQREATHDVSRNAGGSASSPASPAAPSAGSRSTPPRVDLARRLAAIDIGSNSIRQIIADVSPNGAIRVVDEMKAAPRLGGGVGNGGELGESAMRYALDALARMATLARQMGASRIEAVATSAVRDASNGGQFLERVRAETGLKVRVLDGEEEARLSFRSALAHFDLGVGRAVVVDIGGGSLELALSADGLLERLISLPFGAIRLTERFLDQRARRKDVRKLRSAIRDDIRRSLPKRDWRGAQVIGSGGTFTNLAGIHLARQGMQTARTVHGARVPRTELEHILDMLQDMTPEERAAVPGLNPARSDIIVAGFAVAAEVMARLEARELTVSGYGIREGLLLETARVRATIADPGDARQRSVREFAERCHYEAPHAHQVQRLALQLFDSIGARLGCEPSDRQILADAALLHDVGYHINYDKHHKHSYHLILHADMLGMSPEEQVAIAHVARYHRGAAPKKSHRNFGKLDRALQKRIVRLACLLRVADGFDRGHVGAVERIKVRWLDRALRLSAVPHTRARNMRLDLWGATRKSALLARLAHAPVEVVAPDGSVVALHDSQDDKGD
jgi:exopolyphosphatase/guanosine-5'-triphosphate,3'-diphosphate pyrophosphatase